MSSRMLRSLVAAVVALALSLALAAPALAGSGPTRWERHEAARQLARQIRRFPQLKGVRIEWSHQTYGHQAVTFYQSGVIRINPDRRAPLWKIVRHETGHVVDWRNNHHIDWGENIPARYMR